MEWMAVVNLYRYAMIFHKHEIAGPALIQLDVRKLAVSVDNHRFYLNK